MNPCDYGTAALAAILLLAFAVFPHAVEAQGPPKPIIRCVFVADYCAPCHDLTRYMKKHGIPMSLRKTREMPTIEAYPTVFYEVNGRLVQDNGENIRGGNYRLPDTPVTVVEWITKGK